MKHGELKRLITALDVGELAIVSVYKQGGPRADYRLCPRALQLAADFGMRLEPCMYGTQDGRPIALVMRTA